MPPGGECKEEGANVPHLGRNIFPLFPPLSFSFLLFRCSKETEAMVRFFGSGRVRKSPILGMLVVLIFKTRCYLSFLCSFCFLVLFGWGWGKIYSGQIDQNCQISYLSTPTPGGWLAHQAKVKRRRMHPARLFSLHF